MSTNLATLMVGLGYDLTALEKGAPEAFRVINSQTLGMSAEMKRASREGAESFRLIDEALGIHVSRPLTRILTQEFPGLAKALQSVIGVGVGGALVAVGFEAYEKVAKSIEKAQEAQEHFANSTRSAKATFDDIMGSFEKVEILHGLKGLDKKLFEIDYSSAEATRSKIDQMTKVLEENAKAAAEASGGWTTFKAKIGDFAGELVHSPNTLNAEKIDKQLDSFKAKLDALARIDGLNQTHYTAAAISAALDEAKSKLDRLRADEGKTVTTPTGGIGPRGVPLTQTRLLASPEEVAAQQRLVDAIKKLGEVQAGGDISQGLGELDAKAAAAKEALDKEIAAIHAADAASEHWAETLTKAHAAAAGLGREAQPEQGFTPGGPPGAIHPGEATAMPPTDQYEQFNRAVQEAEIHYTNLYHSLGDNEPDRVAAFYVRFHETLQQVIADMRELAGQKLTAPEAKLPQFTGTALPFQPPAAAPVVPTLTAGGTTGAQFDAFSKDQGAQMKAAAAAYEAMVTPVQKYQLAQQELNLLLEKGLIDQAAYTAGMQKASEALVQADDHLLKMQEDLKKLLERSTSASAGVQAFFLQLQIDSAQNGKFAFDLLNQGLKGFEDTLTKAVFEGKAKWKDLFRSMAEEVFKFGLQKSVSGLFSGISQTGFGQTLGLGKLVPNVASGAAGGAELTAAASTLQVGSSTLLTAATTLQAAATQMSASSITSGGSGAIGDLSDSGIGSLPGFASGTDSAPGGFAWVGEQGPELMNLPSGTSVTPATSVRSGGDEHYYDMRGAVVTEELMRKAEFARAMAKLRPGIVGEAVANFNEVQRRTPKR